MPFRSLDNDSNVYSSKPTKFWYSLSQIC